MTELNNDIRELNIDELDAVSGGRRNSADLPGYHPTFRTTTSNPSSPLYGNGSFKDTIDFVDALP